MTTAEPAFLEAGRRWEAGLAARDRKRFGQWLTPWWLVQAALDEALPGVGDRPTVLDPACGDARWLVAVGQRLPGARLVGWDVDPGALAAARSVCAAAGVEVELVRRDALTGPGIDADLVVGNPPYVRPQHLDKAVRDRVWADYATAVDKCDLYAPFLERMLQLAPRLAVVVADTWLCMASFSALRVHLEGHPVDLVARVTDDAFRARVGTVLLSVRPEARWRRGLVAPSGLRVDGTVQRVDDVFALEDAVALPGEGRVGDHWRLRMGVVCGDYKRWVHPLAGHADDRPTCRGRDVRRFAIESREFVRYQPRAMLDAKSYVAPKHAGLFDVPEKLVLAGASGGSLRAAVDTRRLFPLDSCYVSEGEGDVWALCGLLNAAPVNAWYGARYPNARVKAVEVARVPWPAGDLRRVAEAARASDQAGIDREVAAAYGL